MKRTVIQALLLLLVVGAAARAQDSTRTIVRRPYTVEPLMHMAGASGVEGILRRKEELKLTGQQVAQLETIRREEVARRQTESRDLIDLNSRLAAGLIERPAYRDEMDKIDDAQRVAARSVRNRLDQILTEEQRTRMPFAGRRWTVPGEMRFSPGAFRFAPGAFRFSPGDFRFAPGDFRFSPEHFRLAPQNFRFRPGDFNFDFDFDRLHRLTPERQRLIERLRNRRGSGIL